jgi:hypothetical protein
MARLVAFFEQLFYRYPHKANAIIPNYYLQLYALFVLARLLFFCYIGIRMKKIILPILTFFLLYFLFPIFSPPANAQSKTVATCEEWKDIYGKKECPDAVKYVNEKEAWCYDPKEAESYPGGIDLYIGDYLVNTPPSHIVEFDYESCINEWTRERGYSSSTTTSDQAQNNTSVFSIPSGFINFVLNLLKNRTNTTPEVQEVERSEQEKKTALSTINDWIMENNLQVSPERMEKIERERFEEEIYERTPQMTEEIIRQYKEEYNKMFEPNQDQTSVPFRARADILKGEVDIKYPGTDKWVPLKQGDIVPTGAALFTGMDSTLVFSIQDKGVFQVLSFTEFTVSEKTIRENSHTDIEIRTGEVEVSIPGGVYTGTLQISTPNSIAGVKGTHFWVNYDKKNSLTTVGVYEGDVEVKTKGSKESMYISPQGDKPGVVIVEQKISLGKLALTGLATLMTIGGVVWIVRKKSSIKLPKRK